MVRLEPVEDLFGDFFLQNSAFDLGFLRKYFSDENLREALLQDSVMLFSHWYIILEVDLGASLSSTVSSRRLISMSHIHPEHQFVGDLIQERDVGFELWVRGLQNISQLDLH